MLEQKMIGVNFKDSDFSTTFLAIGKAIREAVVYNDVKPDKELLKMAVEKLLCGMYLLNQNQNKYLNGKKNMEEHLKSIENYFNDKFEIYVGDEVARFLEEGFLNGEFVLINYEMGSINPVVVY